jgi:hypothetical protein
VAGVITEDAVTTFSMHWHHHRIGGGGGGLSVTLKETEDKGLTPYRQHASDRTRASMELSVFSCMLY